MRVDAAARTGPSHIAGELLLSSGRRPSRLVGRYTLSKHVGRTDPTGRDRAYRFTFALS